MKNLDFLKYLRAQEDAAYERIKLGHFDENGAAYYRGKHDQAFAMRRDLEERLKADAFDITETIEGVLEQLTFIRKRTYGKRRAMLDNVRLILVDLKERNDAETIEKIIKEINAL